VNLNTKVSKILYQWILVLKPFCLCETWYLHFTTRVFGHSAITPFLGGVCWLYLCACVYVPLCLKTRFFKDNKTPKNLIQIFRKHALRCDTTSQIFFCEMLVSGGLVGRPDTTVTYVFPVPVPIFTKHHWRNKLIPVRSSEMSEFKKIGTQCKEKYSISVILLPHHSNLSRTEIWSFLYKQDLWFELWYINV